MKHASGDIQALKSRLDLVDIVRRYVSLRQVGGRLVGLCPFHNEKTGSFSVNAEKGFLYCFGCQATGDVIDFYCRINGLDFREGLEQLAREAGMALGEYRSDPRQEKARRQRQAAGEMHALARDFFRQCLASPEGSAARDYLQRRGVSQEMSERFQLGCAPADWHGLEHFLANRGFNAQDAVAAGLLSRNDQGKVWDRFRDRLMFPIHEISGKVVAFGGRIMAQGEPKYINSSDTPIYKKGEHLFGLHQARGHLTRGNGALLTEGYLDVIALHQHGFPHACGVLGTSLTPAQVKRLGGLTRHVTLVFDGDAAGEKAALRSAQMLIAQGVACRAALLPQGEDADSLLKSGGAEAFSRVLETAREGLDFCLATMRLKGSSAEVVEWALNFLDELPGAQERAGQLTRLAQGLGLAEHELRSLAAGRARGGRSQGAGGHEGRRAPRNRASLSPGAKKDAELLEFAIRAPAYVVEMDRLGLGGCFSTDRARAFFAVLAAHPGQDVLPFLDERQKSFWGQCSSKARLSEGEVVSWWEDIRSFIDRESLEGRKRELTLAMRMAHDRGDGAEETRLYQALSDLLGRNA